MNKEVICNFLIKFILAKAPKCSFSILKNHLFLILYNLRHIQLAEAEA